jgi:hypothetical protein
LPFTFYHHHLGGLGFFTHQFLFHPSKSTTHPAPPPPNWYALDFPHQHAFVAYQEALLKSTNQLLTQANDKWTQAAQETRYGNIHHTSTPEQ